MEKFLELLLSGIMVGGLYALVAVGIVLVYKATHVVSLAHGGFLILGSYFMWFVSWQLGLPIWLCWIITLAFGALLGFLINRGCLQPLIGQPLMSAFLVTFGIYELLYGVFNTLVGAFSRGLPTFLPVGNLELAGVSVNATWLVCFIIAVAAFGGVWAFSRYTKAGLAMRATAEDHRLAQSTGIRVKQIFSQVWMISGIVCIIAGILLAVILDVQYSLGDLGIIALAVALVGGLDSIPGALIGGLLIGVLQNMGGGYIDPIVGGGFADLTAYIVMLFILLIKPYGLFGEVRIERI